MVRDRRFVGRAWRSLASTRNVFGKVLLILLLQLIPIFGQIVTYGYMLGWLREAAWGIETPMPAHVLGQGDDKFWARGVKAFFVQVLYGMLLSVVWVVASGLVGLASRDLRLGHSVGGSVLVAVVFALAVVATVLLVIECVMGLVRLSLYNDFGSAWQWGAGLSMASVDFGGLIKVGAAYLGLMLLSSALAFVFIAMPVGAALFLGLPGWVSSLDASSAIALRDGLNSLSPDQISVLATGMMAALGAWVFAWLAIGMLLAVPAFIMQAVCWRALGNWAAQLDVVDWGPSSDPLPAGAVRFGQEPPVSPQEGGVRERGPEQTSGAGPSRADRPDAASSLPGMGVEGEAKDMADGPAEGASAGVSSASPTAIASSASTSAGAELVAADARESYVAPDKRSHPVVIIVLSYLVSGILACILSAALGYLGTGAVTTLYQWASEESGPMGRFHDNFGDFMGAWSFDDTDETLHLNDDGTFYLSNEEGRTGGNYVVAAHPATSEELAMLSELSGRKLGVVGGVTTYSVTLLPVGSTSGSTSRSASFSMTISDELGPDTALVVPDASGTPYLANRLD